MNFLSSEKAVSEVIGHVIILGLTITGVAMITLIGVPSIYKLQEMANIRNVEQSFTVLDSRASDALLGDSPIQVIDLNLGGGAMILEPNGTGKESYMIVSRANENDNITIPLGKIKYTLGDRTVAYEGGGVWSKYPSGGSVMLSPPELHYNGKTLTLPAISIKGNGSIGGKGTASVSFRKNSTLVMYPNASQGINRTNPLEYEISGKVYVNVTSDFYDAWADYAKNLIYTKVSTNATKRTASIELTVVPSTLGGATDIANPISFRGLPTDDDTPLSNFSFKIYSDSFNDFKWDIRAKNGNRTLIFFIFKTDLTVGYLDSSNPVNEGETWGTYTYTEQTDAEGKYIDVDLLSNSTNLTYSNQNVGADNANNCQQPVGGRINGINNPDYSWDNLYINTSASNPNRTQSLYNITQHYTWKMGGDVFFFKCSPGSGHDPEEESTMRINYNATGGITFLHLTNNTVDVGIS